MLVLPWVSVGSCARWRVCGHLFVEYGTCRSRTGLFSVVDTVAVD